MEANGYGKQCPFTYEELEKKHPTEPQPPSDETKLLPPAIQSNGSLTHSSTNSKYDDSKEWQCVPYHVRRGTIAIGVLYLLGYMEGLYYLFYFLKIIQGLYQILLAIPAVFNEGGDVSNAEAELDSHTWFEKFSNSPFTGKNPGAAEVVDRSATQENLTTLSSILQSIIAVLFILIIFELMMIYGVVKYKPRFMIPSICSKIIVFIIISVLCLVCLFLGWRMLGIQTIFAVKDVGLALLVQGYLIKIHLRCYKFCKLRRQEMSSVIITQRTEDSGSTKLTVPYTA